MNICTWNFRGLVWAAPWKIISAMLMSFVTTEAKSTIKSILGGSEGLMMSLSNMAAATAFAATDDGFFSWAPP